MLPASETISQPASVAADLGCRSSSPEAGGSNRRTLTIALVSTQRGWGGGEEQARLLLGGLREGGHACHVLARCGSPFAERMGNEGFDVATFSGNGRNPLALWQIRRHLRRRRPDVLHYNDSHALSGAGLASLGLGIRARVAARRVSFAVRSKFCYRRFCDRVICVSGAVAEACHNGGIPAQSIRVVHDGVDPSRIRSGSRQRGRRALGISDRQVLLLTVARLTDCKGHAFLLDALAAVLPKRPQVRLILVGDGELWEPLQAHARRLGIDSHVRFLGYRDDVPDLIQAADLFVFPSHTEGLGSTLIEVMLAGRAIVTTSGGGIPDLTGSDDPEAEPVAWTVPPRNCRALAEAILEALQSPEKCAVLQQRARRRAERLFTARHMVEATLRVYQELLGSN